MTLERRGRLTVDRIKLSTAFPFGLFRAWTYVHLRASLLAWPIPRGRREAPPETASGGNATRKGSFDQAIERYRTGQVIPPKGTGTSSVNYGGAPATGQGGVTSGGTPPK